MEPRHFSRDKDPVNTMVRRPMTLIEMDRNGGRSDPPREMNAKKPFDDSHEINLAALGQQTTQSQCPIVPAWRSDRIKSELLTYSTYLRIYYPILSPPHNLQMSVNKECVINDECVDCTVHALKSATMGCCGSQTRWEHVHVQPPQ